MASFVLISNHKITIIFKANEMFLSKLNTTITQKTVKFIWSETFGQNQSTIFLLSATIVPKDDTASIRAKK